MSEWITQLSDASITAFNKNVSNNNLLQQFNASTDPKLDSYKNPDGSPNSPALAELESLNAWLWKTHPADGYFKIALSNAHPIYLSRNQLLIGGGGVALALFLLLK